LIVKYGFKILNLGHRHYHYQRFKCKKCHHLFILKQGKSKYDSISLQAKITFEYLLNRSLRKVKTSKAVGRVGKDKILKIIINVALKLPSLVYLNQELNIIWSGRYLLDGLFFSVAGKMKALLILSDAKSLDIIDYEIAKQENYDSWFKFLARVKVNISRNDIQIFFVSDGKRGLHQALSELFPNIPVQLCLVHKLRRIYQIIPHIRGDGYDRLFARIASLAITAPLKEIYQSYLNILLGFLLSSDSDYWDKSRQEKLKRIIGVLRFQKSKLHMRYQYSRLINQDTTTNILEGINSFFKERLNLMRGLKKETNVELIIKLLVYYYRFHQFTSSKFKERNGKRPIELNQDIDRHKLGEIIKGKEPYSWIRNLV